jgi:hypothetical protein
VHPPFNDGFHLLMLKAIQFLSTQLDILKNQTILCMLSALPSSISRRNSTHLSPLATPLSPPSDSDEAFIQ